MTAGGDLAEDTVPTATGVPMGIATGRDGAVWFTEQVGSRRPARQLTRR